MQNNLARSNVYKSAHKYAHDDHEHDHGHDHDHDRKIKTVDIITIAIAAALFAGGMLSVGVPRICFFVLSIIIAGYDILWGGLKGIISFKFDELALLSIAAVAAMAIGEFTEGFVVVVLFKIGEIIEGAAVGRSKSSIDALTNLRPDMVTLVKGEERRAVHAKEAKVGDIMLIKPGERVALDGEVIEGLSEMDMSALTGESQPVSVETGDMLLSGSINLNGLLTCRITKDFNNSTIAGIIKLIEESANVKSRKEKLITRFASYYTPAVVAAAVLLVAIPYLLGQSFTVWLSRALVFLVASCPCALVISIPLAYYTAIGKSSKRGVLIKGGMFVDVLAYSKKLVMDKTGTITTGGMEVEEVIALSNARKQQVLKLASACERNSNHPAAKAIVRAYPDYTPVTEYTEIAGKGISAVIEGKTVLCGNKRLMRENGIEVAYEGHVSVYVALGGVLIGGIRLKEEVRQDAKIAIARMREMGVHTSMLTGDNEESAKNIASIVGIEDYKAGLLPRGKVEALEKMKQLHKNVVFVGDGINDGPVLTSADAGVAMGMGSDLAINCADIVLIKDDLTSLAKTFETARKARGIINFNIGFALAVKLVVLSLGAAGIAPMWAAVAADVGVSVLSVINAARI